MKLNQNQVSVRYELFIQDKEEGRIEELEETHLMRYWFEPELEDMLHSFEFTTLENKEWMTGRHADQSSWSV